MEKVHHYNFTWQAVRVKLALTHLHDRPHTDCRRQVSLINIYRQLWKRREVWPIWIIWFGTCHLISTSTYGRLRRRSWIHLKKKIIIETQYILLNTSLTTCVYYIVYNVSKYYLFLKSHQKRHKQQIQPIVIHFQWTDKLCVQFEGIQGNSIWATWAITSNQIPSGVNHKPKGIRMP